MRNALRLFIFLTVLFGLVLPKGTALLLAFMPGSFQTVVLCTGSEMITIILDEDGNPVRTDEAKSEHCTLNLAADPAADVPAHWQRLQLNFTRVIALQDQVAPPAPFVARQRPARAPPLSI